MLCAIMCTQGNLSCQDIKNECRKDKWFPILTYVVNGTKNLPLFSDPNKAKKFIKRNLPKNWLQGVIQLTDEDVVQLRSKFNVLDMNYPNIVRDLPGLQWVEEVIELNVEPDFVVSTL